jgi:hypothetical protein
MLKPQAKVVRLSFGLLVAVYGESSPTDEEWQRYIETMRAITATESLLIFSWGGGPTMRQRRELEEAVSHHQGKVAVVTESRIARGIVKAIHWTGKQIKPFGFNRRDDAFEFLGLDELQRGQALEQARALTTELGLDPSPKLGAVSPAL